jgi:hypothetical protein
LPHFEISVMGVAEVANGRMVQPSKGKMRSLAARERAGEPTSSSKCGPVTQIVHLLNRLVVAGTSDVRTVVEIPVFF